MKNILLAVTLCLAAATARAGNFTFTFSPSGAGKVHYKITSGAAAGTEGDIVSNGSLAVADFSFVNFYFLKDGKTITKVIHDSTVIHDPPGTLLTANSDYGDGFIDATFVNGDSTYEITYSGGGGGGSTEVFPEGVFSFISPTDGSVSPIAQGTGHFYGNVGPRQFQFDMTADEQGKLIGLGTIEGVTTTTKTPNKTRIVPTATASPDIHLAGDLLTGKDGKPGTKMKLGLDGEWDSIPVKATFTSTGTFSDGGSVTNTVSGSAKSPKAKFPIKNAPLIAQGPADASATSWTLALTLAKETVKGKSIGTATALLTLPTGDKVSFSKQTVKYSTKKGYNIKFAKGKKLDGSNQPVLDSKGKPVFDKKSSLQLTGMILQKSGNAWSITDGKLVYQILGQKGSGKLSDF